MGRTTAGRRRTGLRGALLLALCAVALTACLRVELSFVVNDDGSGSFTLLTAVDEQLIALLGGDASDVLPAASDLPPGAVSEPYEADGFIGSRVRVELPDMERVAETLGAVGDADAAVDDFTLAREGDGWRFAATIPPPGEALDEDAGGLDVEAMVEDASYVIRLALPGEVTEHNADRVEDGALVWDLDLTSRDPLTLHARSEPSSGGIDAGMVAVAGLAAAAVAIVAVARLAGRRRGG